MSPIVLRARLRRWRRHTAPPALLLVLLALVAVHHAAPAIGEAHHSEIVAVAELCLGAFTAVGAALVAAGLGLHRWRPAILLHRAAVPRTPRLPQPRTRAGPALLKLLCVSRR